MLGDDAGAGIRRHRIHPNLLHLQDRCFEVLEQIAVVRPDLN